MSDQSLSVHMIAERSKRRSLVAAISESVMLQALADSCLALLVIREVSPIPDNVPRPLRLPSASTGCVSNCCVLAATGIVDAWWASMFDDVGCVQCSPRQEKVLQRSLTVTIVYANYIGIGSEHPNVMQCWSGYTIEHPQ